MLLQYRADANAQGRYYSNALQAALLKGLNKIIQMLLQHRANTNT